MCIYIYIYIYVHTCVCISDQRDVHCFLSQLGSHLMWNLGPPALRRKSCSPLLGEGLRLESPGREKKTTIVKGLGCKAPQCKAMQQSKTESDMERREPLEARTWTATASIVECACGTYCDNVRRTARCDLAPASLLGLVHHTRRVECCPQKNKLSTGFHF